MKDIQLILLAIVAAEFTYHHIMYWLAKDKKDKQYHNIRSAISFAIIVIINFK